VIHSGGGSQEKNAASPRASVPKPRFVSKTYLYLESSNLAVKVGEPFTVDVRLSGKPDTKYDQLAFTLSYDPEVLMPVIDQREDGDWIAAQEMELLIEQNKTDPTTTQNQINYHDGLIRLELNMLEPQAAKSITIARLIFVPVHNSKLTRIDFVTKSGEPGTALSYLRLGEDDVLGSPSDLFDGVIPIDINIQEDGTTPDRLIRHDDGIPQSGNLPASLDLVVRESHVDVGGIVNLDIVLNNPGKLPVDEVEFLVMYNTRVLQTLENNAIHSNGLDINTEKGILRYKGTLRKTHADAQTSLATIRFKALAPTTKSTFKVLVHKHGTLPSTGAYYKGQDILGDPTVLTDGVRTTSISVRPTVSYLNHLQ
jgi:hypothetical protein